MGVEDARAQVLAKAAIHAEIDIIKSDTEKARAAMMSTENIYEVRSFAELVLANGHAQRLLERASSNIAGVGATTTAEFELDPPD